MLLLLMLVFNSLCLPAFSNTHCVLPLFVTGGNSGGDHADREISNAGDCQNAGALSVRCECGGSSPTYIVTIRQCDHLHDSLESCNSVRFFEGKLQVNQHLMKLLSERWWLVQYLSREVGSAQILEPCHLIVSCRNTSVQHCLWFNWNIQNLNEVNEGSGSGAASDSGMAPLFCPAAQIYDTALDLLASTMTTPTMASGSEGTRGSPTGDLNTSSEMGSAGNSDHISIALGGGIAGGILSLVILVLLIIVCCLVTKMIRNERRVRLQPKKATDSSTCSGEGQTNDYEQTKLSSSHPLDQTEDMYETVDDERTKQSTSLSHASSHNSEDMSGNYTYVSSHSCKKRPTIREATCSLRTTVEFGDYSEITGDQQISNSHECLDSVKTVQRNSQPLRDHPTTPRIATLPATNDEYSHTRFTTGAPERFSMPLPPPEEYSRLDVRSKTFGARHSDYCSIELSSFHSDSRPQTTSQEVEVFENEYSLLEEPSLFSEDDAPPLPPPFHPELSQPGSNNEVGIYAEVASVQDAQLGEGNYPYQEPLYDNAMPNEEALYDDITSLEV